MRLTLRTLLAWLDDKLSPAEVREIGKQVAESPFARELVDRIHRVTRQRRLTVPDDSGPDATDPNLVASYLDNELDPDLVTEYEKVCLTSDVHMAEVASVHQVLSLIGQKAKVPVEAKQRMYHLVRGREAIASRSSVGHIPAAPTSREGVEPWEAPAPPSRPWVERFGPAAAAVALIAVLGWSAWMSVSHAPRQTLYLADSGDGKEPPRQPGQEPEPPKKAEPVVATVQPAPGEDSAVPATEATETSVDATSKEPVKAAAVNINRPDLPPGVVAMTEKAQGVFLKFNPEQRQWEPLAEPSPLKSQDRLVSLDPFRNTFDVGSARVDLVGETDVSIGPPPPDAIARLQLAQGRMVLHGDSPETPFEVQSGGKALRITPPAGGLVGVERINEFERGKPESSTSLLRVFVPEGEVALAVEDARETLRGPGAIAWDGGRWAGRSDRPPPAWVTEPRPSPFDVQVGEQFLRYFRPNRPVITGLVEAMEDDNKDVRRMAIRGLRAVGDLSYLVPVLNKADDPGARREAIAVLRATIAQGPDAAAALRNQLARDLGAEQGAKVEKLLVGFTAQEAGEEATFSALVQQLNGVEVGVRELAVDNLCRLTGRDSLEYDPDKPEGRGLQAWRDLLRDHELRHVAPTPAGKAEK